MKNPNKQLSGGFILGDADFVDWVKNTFLSKRKGEKEIPQLKKLKPRVTPEMIAEQVAEAFGCGTEKVRTKGLKRNRAREVAIYLVRDLCGLSCKDLGTFFGGVSGALVTIMYNRIGEEIAQNKRLQRKVEKIKKRIFNI